MDPDPKEPSLASHEDPGSDPAPSLREAGARLYDRRALPCSGPPAAAPAARHAPACLPTACCMMGMWVSSTPALRSSAVRPSVRPLPSPRKDESFRRVSPMVRERGGPGSTTFGGGEKSADRAGLAPGSAWPCASPKSVTTRRLDRRSRLVEGPPVVACAATACHRWCGRVCHRVADFPMANCFLVFTTSSPPSSAYAAPDRTEAARADLGAG